MENEVVDQFIHISKNTKNLWPLKKISSSILSIVFILIFNLIIPTTVLSQGPPPAREWKGKGTKYNFESIPVITIKNFLNGKKPTKKIKITGTLNFPVNAPNKNVPVVVIMHGGGGIAVWEEHWMKIFNNMGLATFMVDSNWPRRKCKKDFKKAIPNCNDVHRGMTRIVDGYRALEFLSKHPRIDKSRIGCLGISLGARGCLYLNVKRFQKMWGNPKLNYAGSIPMYPPCNVRFKNDDKITDTPIHIHVGELDTFFPVDSCKKYVQRLNSKGKNVKITVYPEAHHGFDANPAKIFGGREKMVMRGYNDGRCYYEENTGLKEAQLGKGFHQQITQIGFKKWLTNATEKEKKKMFKYYKEGNKRGYANPSILFDYKCVSKSNIVAYNKEAAKKATRLIKKFFTINLKLK